MDINNVCINPPMTTYRRSYNPTTMALASKLGMLYKIPKNMNIYIVPTCMSAISNVIFYLITNSTNNINITVADTCYQETVRFLSKLSHINLTISKDILSDITPLTNLVILEKISNILYTECDLNFLTKQIKSINPHTLIMIDNSLPTYYNYNPFVTHAQIDILVESLTKYACGSGNAFGGLLITTNKLKHINNWLTMTGAHISPFDSAIISNGLDTLDIRLQKVQQTTQYLSEQLPILIPNINIYTSIKCGLITFAFSNQFIHKYFCSKLNVITYASSFGQNNTLIYTDWGNDIKPTNKPNIYYNHLRLAIGLEDSQILLKDIQQAYRITQKKYLQNKESKNTNV